MLMGNNRGSRGCGCGVLAFFFLSARRAADRLIGAAAFIAVASAAAAPAVAPSTAAAFFAFVGNSGTQRRRQDQQLLRDQLLPLGQQKELRTGYHRPRVPTSPLLSLSSPSSDDGGDGDSDPSPRRRREQINPNDLETPEERKRRMELVRQVQKSFYAGSKGVARRRRTGDGSDLGADAAAAAAGAADGGGVQFLDDVPLWRVQWTELPGHQNVLNCHVAHYTHMFQSVINGPKPWLFGHLYLSGGSENLDNPRYRLLDGGEESEAARVGTLMRVCDYRQLDDIDHKLDYDIDGRLLLLVQALGKFRVVGAASQHVPYAVADVELVTDAELVERHLPAALDLADATDVDHGGERSTKRAAAWGAANAAAVAEAAHWEAFEHRTVAVDECLRVSAGGEGVLDVSPLANFDASDVPAKAFDAEPVMKEYLAASSGKNGQQMAKTTPPQELGESSGNSGSEKRALDLERKVWIDVDKMIQLLGALVASSNGGGSPQRQAGGTLPVPVPTQLLGLLPQLPDGEEWPENFKLHLHVARLKAEKAAVVGTASKSPFVVADDAGASSEYPALRRAQRLSFAVWVLLDRIAVGQLTTQAVLEFDSIQERLEAALAAISAINAALKLSLEQ